MENNYNSDNPELQDSEQIQPELSHSDKIAGVFSEPSNMYEKTSRFPPRTKDWVIPMLLLLVLVILAQTILMNNEQIYFSTKKETMDKVSANIEKQLAEGTITQEQAQQRYDMVEKQMEMGRQPIGIVIRSVSILIFGFIFFFLVIGIQYFFIHVVFKDTGSYSGALVANGLTAYISMIQVVIGAILAILFGRLIMDTSLAALLNSDRSTFAGFIFSKIDPISIWAYAVASIGLSKMFHSSDTKKYYMLVFGIWILGSLLWFLLGKAFPFLQFGQ